MSLTGSINMGSKPPRPYPAVSTTSRLPSTSFFPSKRPADTSLHYDQSHDLHLTNGNEGGFFSMPGQRDVMQNLGGSNDLGFASTSSRYNTNTVQDFTRQQVIKI